jgi:sugar/nucleoside kinase (ribokinase family)
MKYDIITFGSATRDIYLRSKKFSPVSSKDFPAGKAIQLGFGSKIEMEEISFSTGGGGANAAVTFAGQGLKTAYCGKVGNDYFGNLIIKELKKLKIDASFISRTKEKSTNVSVILSYPGGDKTILVYRGAADLFKIKDVPLKKIKNAKWFYLAPFSGKLAKLTENIIDLANKNKIRVAMNPGYSQLTLPQRTLERILKKIDVLILNQEEASLLTGIPYQKEKEIFKKIDKLVPGICVMTKGREGVVASDGKYLYKAPALKIKLVDTTGAGDSFNSGFLSSFIKAKDISSAIQLGIANAAACLQELGAKQGLLSPGQKYKKVKVIKERL